LFIGNDKARKNFARGLVCERKTVDDGIFMTGLVPTMEDSMRALFPILGVLLLAFPFSAVDADAASINIVALGASGTAG
jgi:hypothetical protein